MSYSINTIPQFDKQIKRLSNKYPSFISDFKLFVEGIKLNPLQGEPLGNNCFKIRLAITSKGKGKSGGARIITHLLIENKLVYFLTIYDKSEKENLSDLELKSLLKFVKK